jgi:hypothetical protein
MTTTPDSSSANNNPDLLNNCELSLSHELQRMDEDEEYVEHDLDGDTDDSEDDDDDDEDDEDSGSSGDDDDEDEDMSGDEDRKRTGKSKSRKRRGGNENKHHLLLKDRQHEKSGGGSGSFYLDISKHRVTHDQIGGCESPFFDHGESAEMRAAALKQLQEQNFVTVMQKDELTLQVQEGLLFFLF